MAGFVFQWEEAAQRVIDRTPYQAIWDDLGRSGGSLTTGLRRVRVAAGNRSTPPHRHLSEEEIFYVLAGSGLVWADGRVYEIRAGDGVVFLPGTVAHTLIAGEEGLDLLAYGCRGNTEACVLPRSEVAWLGSAWVKVGEGGHPWAQEAAVGELEVGEPRDRPDFIKNIDEVRVGEGGNGPYWQTSRDIGRGAGSKSLGMRHVSLAEGKSSFPPHCHSAEEEIFLVLEGRGICTLGEEEHELRPGTVVVRPAGTGVAHGITGGPGGLVYLSLGERKSSDISYMPRSGKIFIRGLGVMGRIEPAGYWDGEV